MRVPGQIEAVIFDMDGVLVDTEHLWDEVREELTGEWGGRYTPEAQQAMMGMSSREWSRYLHDVVGLREPPDVINGEVVRRMLARYEADLPVVPGAVDAVRGARFCGLPTRGRVIVEPRADRHRPAPARADGALRGDRVVRGGRPREAGARRLPRGGAAPRRGARPVRRGRGLRERDPRGAPAGMRVIAYPNRHYPPADEVLALADATVTSVADVSRALARA